MLPDGGGLHILKIYFIDTESSIRFSVKLGSSSSFEITDTYTIDLYVTFTLETQQKFLLESGSGYIRTENEATITRTSAGGSIDRKAVHVTTPEGGDIKNELVDKSSILDKTDGTISWRVDVNPQAATLEKAVVKDVLNKSLQLSHDSVKLYKSVHDAQGNIKPDMGEPISWVEVSNLTFEVEPGVDGSSVLSVALPDGKGAYTLLYDTTIVEAVSAGYVQSVFD